MSKKLVEEIIWEQLAPILEGLAPIDAELLTEGEDLASADPKKLLKSIMALKINPDNWGKSLEKGITNKDREIFRMHAQKIPGDSVEDKLKSLGAFMEQSEEVKTNWGMQADPLNNLKNISQLISNVVLVKTISKILNQFEDTSAGFIMESFFAALGGGKREGGKGTIVDFQVGDTLYSSKLYSPSQRYITGSFDYLKEVLLAGKTITYFIALKRPIGGQISLQFFKQEIKIDNLFKWMKDGRKETVKFKYKKELKTTDSDTPDEALINAADKLLSVIYSIDSAYKKKLGKGALGTTSFESPAMRTMFLYIIASVFQSDLGVLHGELKQKIDNIFQADPALKDQIEDALRDDSLLGEIRKNLFKLVPKDFQSEKLKQPYKKTQIDLSPLEGTQDPPSDIAGLKKLAGNIINIFKSNNEEGLSARQKFSLNSLFTRQKGKEFNNNISKFLAKVKGALRKDLIVNFKAIEDEQLTFVKSLTNLEDNEKNKQFLALILLNYYKSDIFTQLGGVLLSLSSRRTLKDDKFTHFLPMLEETSKNSIPIIEDVSFEKIKQGLDTLQDQETVNIAQVEEKYNGIMADRRAVNYLFSNLKFESRQLAKINLNSEDMKAVASINIGEDYLFRIVQKALEVKKGVLEENIKLIQELQTELSNITVNLNKFYENYDTQSASDAKGNADNISSALKGILPEPSGQPTTSE